jgi:hypothetical protein
VGFLGDLVHRLDQFDGGLVSPAGFFPVEQSFGDFGEHRLNVGTDVGGQIDARLNLLVGGQIPRLDLPVVAQNRCGGLLIFRVVRFSSISE